MKTIGVTKIKELQQKPENIRNICILAHVDHGKTTLADTLVASNGIISQRMAGKLRYLDSREDEQIRGITMKSSAISLIYNKDDRDTLINLIDSPGHIDFSSEVSTAVRLCEGAIVVVDVVEGVCPQTHAVLRQAWLESIKPILVLNKIDRLIVELKMSPLEAHIHLQQRIQQVNAIMGELFTSHFLEKSSVKTEKTPTTPDNTAVEEKVFDWSSGLDETDDSHLYFSPDQGNVIFASAIDRWGFGISHFAQLYATKLGVNAGVLNKTLWGDFYLEGKTKRIKKGAQEKAKKPLFVTFILENLWAVYEAVLERRDKDMIEKIVKSLNLKIPPRDSKHSDPKVLLQSLCSQWLPLSKAVLAMVVEKLPTPKELEEEKVEKLICSNAQNFENLPIETQKLKQAFLSCSSKEDAPVIIYVSKLFPIERKNLPENKQRPLTHEQIAERRELARKRHAEKLALLSEGNAREKQDSIKDDMSISGPSQFIITPEADTSKNPDDQVFIAFARVFSGTVKKGQKLYILGPKHDPTKALKMDEDNRKHISEFTVEELYLFMGRELEALEEIPAGNIIGIGGLEEHILKSATISDTVACPAFTDMFFEAAPIVRVAVEPTNAGDMDKLNYGLKLLNQADPSVEILIQETGEQVIIAAGEVHLQKCLDDLTERFAKVKVNASSPIVPFRETVIPLPKFDRRNEAIEVVQSFNVKEDEDEEYEEEEVLEPGLVEIQTANKLCSLRIRAIPLPQDVVKLLEKNSDLIKVIDQCSSQKTAENQKGSTRTKLINDQMKEDVVNFKKHLIDAFSAADEEEYNWDNVVNQIWCFGPRRNGPNILVNRTPQYSRPSIWACVDENEKNILKSHLTEFDYCVASGFQMASMSGPLCEEAMYGVCFIVENWERHSTPMSLKERKLEIKEIEHVKRIESAGSLKGTTGGKKDCQKNIENGVKSLSSELCDSLRTQITKTVTLECVSSSETDKITSLPKDEDELSSPKEFSTCDKNEAVTSTVSSGITINNTSGHEDDTATTLEPNSPTWQQPPLSSKEVYGRLSGQLMSAAKEGCRRAFQSQPQRLMWAMYRCEIQATADVLGKMYGVLSKRHGRILHEDLKEGTSVFNIDAVLPVVESFGFAEEIRKRTSGLASPQLRFSHWEVIELDPFWVPTTEEEYMHFGEKADSENVARKYMNSVRRRKGLHTDDKLVEFGEKQRTLKKNK